MRLPWQREVVDGEEVLEVANCWSTLAVGNEMDFIVFAPSMRDPFREAVDFSHLVLNLAKVSWLVEVLV